MDLDEARSRLAVGVDAIECIVAGIRDEEAGYRPTPDAWCVLDVLDHLRHEEGADFRPRLRAILQDAAAPWPPPVAAGAARHAANSARTLVDGFREERAVSLAWLATLDDPDLDRAHDAGGRPAPRRRPPGRVGRARPGALAPADRGAPRLVGAAGGAVRRRVRGALGASAGGRRCTPRRDRSAPTPRRARSLRPSGSPDRRPGTAKTKRSVAAVHGEGVASAARVREARQPAPAVGRIVVDADQALGLEVGEGAGDRGGRARQAVGDGARGLVAEHDAVQHQEIVLAQLADAR